MLTNHLEIRHVVMASSFFVGALLLGLLLESIVTRKLRKRATMTSWGGETIIAAALHRVIVIWFVVAGTWAAVETLPLAPRLERLAGRTLTAVLVIATIVAAARLAGDLVRLYALRTQGAVRSSSIFVTLARLAVMAIGLLVLLQTLGVSITPLLTALGVGGLAVALALQDTLSNLFAGLHIIASRKVRIGDYIRLESGEEGYVVDINWRNTSIRQLPDDIIVVPNAQLANAIVTNFYQPVRESAIQMELNVAYDSDLQLVERVTIEVATAVMKDVPGGVKDFAPLVRYNEFQDSGIGFTVVMRCREYSDRYLIIHEFMKRLTDRYRAERIEIPYPVRQIMTKEASPPGNGSRYARTRSGGEAGDGR